jgi:hypothetical protein
LPSPNQPFCDIPPPSSLVCLKGSHSLTSKWQSILQESAHSAPLRKTICKYSSWSDEQFDMVDWMAMKSCLQRVPRVHQLSYCKLIHGQLNTIVQNHKYYNTSELCPYCQSSAESFKHMVYCPHLGILKHRKEQQQVLWHSLVTLHTLASLLGSLRAGIQSCGFSSSSTATSETWPSDFPIDQDPPLISVAFFN